VDEAGMEDVDKLVPISTNYPESTRVGDGWLLLKS
jgi:hypothetical protein